MNSSSMDRVFRLDFLRHTAIGNKKPFIERRESRLLNLNTAFLCLFIGIVCILLEKRSEMFSFVDMTPVILPLLALLTFNVRDTSVVFRIFIVQTTSLLLWYILFVRDLHTLRKRIPLFTYEVSNLPGSSLKTLHLIEY